MRHGNVARTEDTHNEPPESARRLVVLSLSYLGGTPGTGGPLRGAEEGIEIELRLTQAELASWVGTTRESVNKVLGTFRDYGLIEVEGQRVTILDRPGLKRRILY